MKEFGNIRKAAQSLTKKPDITIEGVDRLRENMMNNVNATNVSSIYALAEQNGNLIHQIELQSQSRSFLIDQLACSSRSFLIAFILDPDL